MFLRYDVDALFLITLFFLGLGGGFLSGLLGLGGASFMIPPLLYVAPLLGVVRIDMKQVAAVSMVQVPSAFLSGVLLHHKNRFVGKSLLLHMGIANAAGILAGSLLSKQTKSTFLLAIFASMTLLPLLSCLFQSENRGRTFLRTSSSIMRLLRWL